MDNWVDIASIVASLATFGALLALAFEIRNSRRAEKRQASFEIGKRWEQLSEKRALAFDMSWKDMKDFNRKYVDTPKNRKFNEAYIAIGEYFESLGESAFNGLLDKQMVFLMMGEPAIHYFGKFRERIKFTQKNSPLTLLYFEWFALEAKKATPQIGKALIEATDALRKEVTI
jgi:hypothetical protein